MGEFEADQGPISIEGETDMSSSNEVGQIDFPGEVYITMDDPELTFEKAKRAALERAGTYDSDPTLLAWFDMKKGRHSPGVSCDE